VEFSIHLIIETIYFSPDLALFKFKQCVIHVFQPMDSRGVHYNKIVAVSLHSWGIFPPTHGAPLTSQGKKCTSVDMDYRCIIPIASHAYSVPVTLHLEASSLGIWEHNSHTTELYPLL
jgi:hypothetical protein